MFDSRVRRGGAVRFVPRLEALGVRITPASKPSGTGDIWAFTTPADVRHNGDEIPMDLPGTGTVSIFASKPTNSGDIWAFTTLADVRHNGDEIPMGIVVPSAGALSISGSKPGVASGTNPEVVSASTAHVQMYGSKPGVVSGSNAEVLTEMPTYGVWVDG